MGTSHGGLVVAAAMIQRPDLFKVAVPIVGAFDMIRFEQFTVGESNAYEFGTVNNETDFLNLYSYSPYHNISDSVNYPATMIVTSENDDRVPALHSYKFTAAFTKQPFSKKSNIIEGWKKIWTCRRNRI